MAASLRRAAAAAAACGTGRGRGAAPLAWASSLAPARDAAGAPSASHGDPPRAWVHSAGAPHAAPRLACGTPGTRAALPWASPHGVSERGRAQPQLRSGGPGARAATECMGAGMQGHAVRSVLTFLFGDRGHGRRGDEHADAVSSSRALTEEEDAATRPATASPAAAGGRDAASGSSTAGLSKGTRVPTEQKAGVVVALKPGPSKQSLHKSKSAPTRRPIHASVTLSEILKRQRGPRGFNVIEFFPNGIAKEWDRPVSAADLGIHPRDLSLFVTGSRKAAQRATVTVQDNAIFIKTENVRAIVRADRAVVFKSRSGRENQNIIAPMLQAIGSPDQSLPFELCAVEVLLHATVMYFERRISHLSWMLDVVIQDLQGRDMQEPFAAVSNETMIQQLVPLDKALMATRNDAKETSDAMQSILMDEKQLALLCLTEQRNSLSSVVPEECGDFNWDDDVNRKGGKEPRPPQQRAGVPDVDDPLVAVRTVPRHAVLQAERMLQSYEREVSSVESTLREMEEHLDTTRQLWGMKLDSARNHMMLLNLWLSMLSISLMITTVPATVYGMNVQHGLEDVKWYFYLVGGLSITAGIVSFPTMAALYNRFWRRHAEAEVSKVNRLRVMLMQHLDDLDDILEACDSMPDQLSRAQFAKFLRSALPDLRLSRDTVEFLFNQFDLDRNGTFDAISLVNKSHREVEALGKATFLGHGEDDMYSSPSMPSVRSHK